jgi:hypothetical protein
MSRQNASDHVLVDVDPERLSQLLGDLGTAEAGVASFEFQDGPNEIRWWAFGTWLSLPL